MVNCNKWRDIIQVKKKEVCGNLERVKLTSVSWWIHMFFVFQISLFSSAFNCS
jgi:hypothetical protein